MNFLQLASAAKKVGALSGDEHLTRLLSAIEKSGMVGQSSLAVVGQMRSGKSTLLNALLGHDIAPTAVNECTATVNRFTYASNPTQHDRFLIHWRDEGRVEEHRNLEKITEWIGQNQNAQAASFLDFFTDAPFLKDANIIDTPGLRSMLDSHESAIRSFLSQESLDAEGNRQAEATWRHGAAADAIIYVVGPNARENDSEVLGLFGEKTRLPGSNPYNGIAVVHKWEPEWHDMAVDPEVFLKDKICRLRKQIGDKVSRVIAASGLLGRCSDWLTEEHWEFFTKCGTLSTDQVEDLTLDFLENDTEDLCFPYTTRLHIFNDLTKSLAEHMAPENARSTAWATIRFMCRFACVRQVKCSTDFQNQVKQIAGIEILKEALETQFFARSQLIKLGTTISKLWQPAREALVKLHLQQKRRKRDMKRGRQVLQLLEARNSSNSLKFAIDYVRDTFEALEGDAIRAENEGQQLSEISKKLERQFRSFERDMQVLELLDQKSNELGFSKEELLELRALFGANGMDIEDRLAQEPTEHLIQERYCYWASKKQQTYGPEERVCMAVEEKFQEMLATIS